MKEFSYGAIEAATNGFAVENLIGKGSHGVVYRGRLDDGTAVAVKKSAHGDAGIRNEIAVLASAADCPCIVRPLGAGRDSAGQPFLVMHLMPNGSLRRALQSSPPPGSAPAPPPSWPRRMAIALRIARAVASLHEASPPVVHRDVKSENVLFDEAWDARLADFSLAVRIVGGGGGRTEPAGLPPAGTIGYLDPSYTESRRLSTKNDVFSFGVLLLELVSSRKAMDAGSDPCSIVAWAVPMIRVRRYDEVVDGRVRPSAGTERSAVARILRVAARCAAEKAEERPAMGEVVRELEGVVGECVWWWWARHGISWRSILRNYRVWSRRRVGTKRIVCKDHLLGGRSGGGGGEFDLDFEFEKVLKN